MDDWTDPTVHTQGHGDSQFTKWMDGWKEVQEK